MNASCINFLQHFSKYCIFSKFVKKKRLDVIIYWHANKTLGLLQYDQHILLLVLKPDILNIICLYAEEKLVHDVPLPIFLLVTSTLYANILSYQNVTVGQMCP